ncbi:MAG: G5 domain-containing protein [Clostridiales bacterium]|jgi:LysM repeat protein|nr:G5 domain-containing protein [Clostridiales bacterium]
MKNYDNDKYFSVRPSKKSSLYGARLKRKQGALQMDKMGYVKKSAVKMDGVRSGDVRSGDVRSGNVRSGNVWPGSVGSNRAGLAKSGESAQGAKSGSDRAIRLPGVSKRRAQINPRAARAVRIAALAVIILFSIWFFTRKNAFEVYVGDAAVGIIAKDNDITEQSLRDTAIAKLATEVGAQVRVDEMVTLKPIHASGKKISEAEYIVGEIYDKWPYLVEADVITVDGVELAALKDEEDGADVLRRLAEQYVASDAALIEKEFVENVEAVQKFVKPSVLITADEAFEAFNRGVESEMDYEVRQGDTLSKIAAQADMTVDEILDVNADLNLVDNLNIGQVITLIIKKPIVSVKTVEETTRTDLAAKETEIRGNTRQPVGYSKVIQQGRDGQKETTLHISRLDGIEVSKEIVSERVLVEPITEVIERGAASGE